MTAISASFAEKSVCFKKDRFYFFCNHQRQAQRTRKVWLPVLLHHNRRFSRLCKLDSTEKHDSNFGNLFMKKSKSFKKRVFISFPIVNGGGFWSPKPLPCARHWNNIIINQLWCQNYLEVKEGQFSSNSSRASTDKNHISAFNYSVFIFFQWQKNLRLHWPLTIVYPRRVTHSDRPFCRWQSWHSSLHFGTHLATNKRF